MQIAAYNMSPVTGPTTGWHMVCLGGATCLAVHNEERSKLWQNKQYNSCKTDQNWYKGGKILYISCTRITMYINAEFLISSNLCTGWSIVETTHSMGRGYLWTQTDAIPQVREQFSEQWLRTMKTLYEPRTVSLKHTMLFINKIDTICSVVLKHIKKIDNIELRIQLIKCKVRIRTKMYWLGPYQTEFERSAQGIRDMFNEEKR